MSAVAEGRRVAREEAQGRRAEAAELKARMDPWVEKLGGWDKVGIKADLAAIASHLAPDDDPIGAASVAATISIVVGGLGSPGIGALRSLQRVHEAFSASKDPQALYVSLIREAHGIVVPGLDSEHEWPFEILLLPLDEMFADQVYQRPEHEPFIREMIIGFDERLVGAIDVAQRSGTRKKSERYAILDGQQRWSTMKQVGKKTCWCAVYNGMTLPDEASFFYHKNRDRKTMAYYYAFRARLLSGDASAKMIAEIVESAAFRLGATTDSRDVIGSVRAVEDIYELPGGRWGNALTPTLDTVRACFYGRPSSLDGSLLRGLGRFYALYDRDELQIGHFREQLTALGPQLVLGRARDLNDSPNVGVGSKIGVAVATMLASIHNQGLPRAQRIDLDRIPRPQRLRARKRF
jgi:hypothetical protein